MFCNRDFVDVHEMEAEEEAWLRRVLEEHVAITGSPRAAVAARRNGLPFVRVQPVHLQATVSDTWNRC